MSATLDNVDRAAQDATDFLLGLGLGYECFGAILSMREAMYNAVLHGSGQDASKLVRCRMSVCDGELALAVEDQGPGFDWESCSLEPPNPHETGGRGLSIMKSYFPRIEFKGSGNRVEMHKPVKGEAMSDVKREGNAAVLQPEGDIVISRVELLRNELKRLVDEGVDDLTVDFSGVAMMDSIGIGLLIATHNSLSSRGSRLKIAHASTDILGLLETMRLNKHFEIID